MELKTRPLEFAAVTVGGNWRDRSSHLDSGMTGCRGGLGSGSRMQYHHGLGMVGRSLNSGLRDQSQRTTVCPGDGLLKLSVRTHRMEYRAAATWSSDGKSKTQPRTWGSGNSSNPIDDKMLWLPNLRKCGAAAPGDPEDRSHHSHNSSPE